VNKKFDWDMIEKQYVSGTMSLRELARLNAITNHSLVMEHSRRREWARKRADYRARTSDRAVALLSNSEARRMSREVEVRDNAIDAIDEAITKMRADMQKTTLRWKGNEWVEEPLMVIKPQDLALLIDRLNVLFGRPSSISEERSLGLNVAASTGPLGADVLRGIVEATRGIVPSGSERSPIPRLGRAGEN
jgi:hypothetical protein